MPEYHVSAYLEGSSRRKLYDRVKARNAKEAIRKTMETRKKQARHKSTREYFKGENAHGWKATLSTTERQKRQSSGFSFGSTPRRRSSGFDGLW